MTNRPPTIPKWPFIFADAALLIVCAWVINQALAGRAYWVAGVAIFAWMFGAWICVLPWLKEFQFMAKDSENEKLTTAVEQIQKLEEIGARVQAATGSWQSAQDAAARVTNAAKEIEERIKTDSKDFMEFAERINGDEKQHLRLEVEKLRRSEAEWLQVAARMLDHTFALTAAALRSGQPNLGTQMTNFQTACRDAARRVGLVAFHPGVGDAFDEKSQQLEDPNAKPEEGSVVSDILATGYTFQGQLLRKSLVRLSVPGAEPQVSGPEPAQAAIAPELPAAQGESADVAVEADQFHDERDERQGEAGASSEIEDFVVDTYRPAPQGEGDALEPLVNQEVDSPVVAAEFSEGDSMRRSFDGEADHSPLQTSEEVVVEVSAADLPVEDASLEVAAVESPAEERVVEVAALEPAVEQAPEEERPRRRQRKPDPQTSLPL